MSNLGKIQRCEDLTVFRVDRRAISTGEQMRRYHYMQREVQLISQILTYIDAGPASLVRYLSTPEWKHLDLSNEPVNLDSDTMKMCVVLEAIFEHTRAKIAPSLPKRFNCVFVWPTLETANQFRAQYLPNGVIHRCLVREGETVELDGGLLPPGINLSNLLEKYFSAEFRATQLRAEKYWNAKDPATFPELLVVGNVEVIGIN